MQAPLSIAVSPKVLGGDSNSSGRSSGSSSSAEGSPSGLLGGPRSADAGQAGPRSAAEAIEKRRSSGARQPTPPKNKRAQGSRRGPRTKTIAGRRNSPQDLDKKVSTQEQPFEVAVMPARKPMQSRGTDRSGITALARTTPTLHANSYASMASNSAESVATDMEMSFSFSKAEAAAAALGENVRLDDSDEAGEDGMEITQADLENSNTQKYSAQRTGSAIENSHAGCDGESSLPPRERSPTPKH